MLSQTGVTEKCTMERNITKKVVRKYIEPGHKETKHENQDNHKAEYSTWLSEALAGKFY